jgi:hypothetical protein
MTTCSFCLKPDVHGGVESQTTTGLCMCAECVNLAVKALKDPRISGAKVIDLEAYRAVMGGGMAS